VKQLSGHSVMLNHTIRFHAKTSLTNGLRLQVGPYVHACRVEPDEERFTILVSLIDKIQCSVEEFFVNCLHPLHAQRTGILNLLCTNPAPTWVDSVIICVSSPAMHYTSRTEHFKELRVLRVIGAFGLLLTVQVVKVTEKLVKSMDRRKEFVAIAHVVLTELPANIALRLEQFRYRRIFRLKT